MSRWLIAIACACCAQSAGSLPATRRSKSAASCGYFALYCANAPCQNSTIAARALDGLGYTNVAEYVEGKQDWVEAGLRLEKSAALTGI